MHVLRPLAATAAFATAAFAIAATLGALAVPTSASAAAEDADITWAVRPATPAGPDGRSWIETELDPGEEAIEYAEVSNFSDSEVSFALASADGYFTETGRFSMLTSDVDSTGAGTWLTADETITLAGGESGIVAIAIDVPDDATPGDHAAGFAASVYSTGADAGGATLGIESRVGFRVMIRVTGDLAPSIAIDQASANYEQSWNPLHPGAVTAHYTVRNDGNTRLEMTTGASISETRASAANDPTDLLPGEAREINAEVEAVWPLGFVTLSVATEAMSFDAAGEPVAPVTASQSVVAWAPPWPQLIVLLGFTLVVAAIVVGRRRRTALVTQQIQEAREAGRREARADATAPKENS
ncbi:hypothetical protein ACWPKO_25675 (plasmid) [Coraliomargarita sp. W4R53]